MDYKQSKRIEDIIENLPPNYTVGGVYLNGVLCPVERFSYAGHGLGYFINGGQVVLVDTSKVNGLSFAAAEAAEVEEEEEE